MFAKCVDRAVSRAMRSRTGGVALGTSRRKRSAEKCPGGSRPLTAAKPRGVTHSADLDRLTTASLVDAGLNVASRCAAFLTARRPRGNGRVRWLDFSNKIAAYRLFEGHGRGGGQLGLEAICRLDPYSRLFAGEGYSYRNVRRPAAPELSLVAHHAGIGLRLAELALERIDDSRCETEAFAEFSAVCGRQAMEGFRGIMEEALGLVTRNMYPHLVQKIDEHLRTTSREFRARFWHGVGRGIYFAPSNIPPFRTAPWRGVDMCLRETPDATTKRNALAGFCFALTTINLQHPEVVQALLTHHPAQTEDLLPGMRSALVVWDLAKRGSIEPAWMAPSFASAQRLSTRLPVPTEIRASEQDWYRPELLFSVGP